MCWMTKKLLKELYRMVYDFHPEDHSRRMPDTGRLEIIEIAKRSYMRGYTIEEIEDAFQEAVMYVLERCKEDPTFAKKVSVSSVTYNMRVKALRAKRVSNGYNQRGTVPKGGRTLHVHNLTDENGSNIIEQLGYDSDGNLITGTGWKES